jgi:ElaB/YqjD/DUF883 family membrane-anchored ribosome-binding protein
MIPNDAQPLPASRGLPQMSPATSRDVDRLREDFRTFVSDCQTLFRNATNLSGEGATLARSELTKRLSDAQVRLDAMREQAAQQATRLRSTTEDYVRREPFKAVGIAVAAGALAALLLSRR